MLSLRAIVGRVGYAGGLDLGFTTLGATRFSADAHLLGLGARLGLGGQLALTGGFGSAGPRGTKATRVPLELTLELPLGPLRVLLRQGLALRVTGPAVEDRALGPFADAWSLLGRGSGATSTTGGTSPRAPVPTSVLRTAARGASTWSASGSASRLCSEGADGQPP